MGIILFCGQVIDSEISIPEAPPSNSMMPCFFLG